MLLLSGPRHVGKTVMLKQVANELLKSGWPAANLTYFDFEDPIVPRSVSPQAVIEAAPDGMDPDRPRIFLLDEIRYADRWDLWLNEFAEQEIGRVVATNSGVAALPDESGESGQGRWGELVVEPLTFGELVRLSARSEEPLGSRPPQVVYLVEQYLRLGGFPEVVGSEDHGEARLRLREVLVERAIHRDFARHGADLVGLRNLFVYLVQKSGSGFVASDCASALGVDAEWVEEWVRALEDTLLLVRLENRSEEPAVRACGSGSSKIYASDPGLVSALSPLSLEDPRLRGRLFGAAVFRHLRAVAREVGGELTYFRGRDQQKIDFVLEAPGRRVAVGVTCSAPPLRGKRQQLQELSQEIGATGRWLLHGGPVMDGEAIPVSRFLSEPDIVLTPRSES